MRWLSLSVLLLFQSTVVAQEKVRIDIGALSDLTNSNPCNVKEWWGESLLDNMRRQLEVSLEQNQGLDVVEADLLRSYRPARDSQVETVHKSRLTKNSQFSIRPSLQTFNLCQVTLNNQTSMKAAVSIQIHILDTKDGRTIDSFVAESRSENMIEGKKLDLKGVSLGSGIFKDSPVGKAMTIALSQASDGIAKRLPASTSQVDVNIQMIKKYTP